MIEQAEELSRIGQEMKRKVPIHLKIDTGINRYGVLPGKPALDMARKLLQFPGVILSGIYAHESGAKPTEAGVSKMAFEVASLMNELAKMLKKQGIPLETVSVGASPTFRATCRFLKEKAFSEITEIHPGECVIGDILYMKGLGNTREACVLKILTAVMSTSHKRHAVIDAGYKTFGADSMIGYRETPNFFWQGLPSFGSIEGRRDLWLGRLGAETGWVYYVRPQSKLTLGERLEIVPNNATLVMNIHDQAYGVRNGRVEKIIRITGRGFGS
jgi:D-serine deaminase-like pyridoxal phosphate-dependent protein